MPNAFILFNRHTYFSTVFAVHTSYLQGLVTSDYPQEGHLRTNSLVQLQELTVGSYAECRNVKAGHSVRLVYLTQLKSVFGRGDPLP